MTGLDQVKQVFAQEKHDGANQAKPDNAANQAEYFGVVADFAQHIARACADDHGQQVGERDPEINQDRKSTRLNSSHVAISYAVFCLKKKKQNSSNYLAQPERSTYRQN